MKIKEVNLLTGEEIIRDATEAELEQARLDAIETEKYSLALAAKETAKAALLEKLGITEEEAKLLLS